ncbi:unnamed protein product [Discula destructiva]
MACRLLSYASPASFVCHTAKPTQQLQRIPKTLAASRTLTTTSSSSTTYSNRQARLPRCRFSSRSPIFLLPARLSPVAPLRTYHSYDHPSPASPFSSTERAILTAAYAHVPGRGFSHEALTIGARDAGYLDISTNVLPNGVFSLVQWHMVAQREALANGVQEMFGGDRTMGVGEKVEALMWKRLMGNTRLIGRWQEALAIMAQTSHVPESIKELAKLSDEIWYLAGDTAVDPSWYTKRASLSAVYASTELFMTTDRSRDFVNTKDFLRRRLHEVQGVGGTLRSVSQWVGFTASAGLNVLRSKGVPI